MLKKKLFAIDLDGTLLSDSRTGAIHPSVKSAINLLKKEGHIVCLFTGRPWRATKSIYKTLGLNTVVVNYNGAHIHHPKQYDFIPVIQRIKINAVMKILNSKDLKDVSENIVVEGPGYIHIKKKAESHFAESFIQVDEHTHVETPINYIKMGEDPTGVLIEIKPEYAEHIHQIRGYFRAKYGDMAAFTYWDTGAENNPILEFTNYKARKDIALIKVARYYGIDMSDTVAFGDGFNDVKMLKVAGVGVAMANADDQVKSYANVVSKHSNKDGGVAKFIRWYLNRGYKSVDKTIYSITRKGKTTNQILSDD